MKFKVSEMAALVQKELRAHGYMANQPKMLIRSSPDRRLTSSTIRSIFPST